MRILILIAGPFWMVHDWMIDSRPAFIADVLAFLIGLWKLFTVKDRSPGPTLSRS